MHPSHPTSNKPLLKVIFSLGLIVIAFWVASLFPDLVLMLIVSTLVAFILRPLVRILEYRLGLRRGFAVAIVFLVVGGLATFVLVEFVPLLIDRASQLYARIKVFPFEEKLTFTAKELAAQIPFVDPMTVGQKVHEFIVQIVQSTGEWTGTAASYLVSLAIFPFITYFILAEGDIGIKKLVEQIPNKYFEMILNVMDKLETELVSYLRGLILECGSVGVLSIIGFSIIGVPYAILIGTLTGIANLVPYLGPIIGSGLAVFVSLMATGDFQMLPAIALLWLIIRLIDDLLLQPLCFGKSLDMHPVAVVLTLIVGHQIMGIAGMVISIPIATILRVCATETYWGLKNYTITA
jgi:putative permease